MATRRNRNQRSQRNRNQKNRSQRNRRGGEYDNYELNLRNCKRYYHVTDPSFCTSKAPGGDATAAEAINYPGIENQMRGEKPTVRIGRNKGMRLLKGY